MIKRLLIPLALFFGVLVVAWFLLQNFAWLIAVGIAAFVLWVFYGARKQKKLEDEETLV